MSDQGDAALSLMDKHGVPQPWISTPPNNRGYLILQGVWTSLFHVLTFYVSVFPYFNLHNFKQHYIN